MNYLNTGIEPRCATASVIMPYVISPPRKGPRNTSNLWTTWVDTYAKRKKQLTVPAKRAIDGQACLGGKIGINSLGEGHTGMNDPNIERLESVSVPEGKRKGNCGGGWWRT